MVRTPITAATEVHLERPEEVPKTIDTLRLLSNYANFSENYSDGWNAILDICESFTGEPSVRRSLLIQIFQLWAVEIRTNPLEDMYAHLGFYVFEGLIHETPGNLALKLMGKNSVEARRNCTGYTPLLYQIATGGVYTKAVLDHDPDLHRSSTETDFTPYEESPTSLAMYSSMEFAQWLDDLTDHGVDFEKFSEEELDRGLLLKAGWTSENLLTLFRLRRDWAVDYSSFESCCDCFIPLHEVRVQPYWVHLLEIFKKGKDTTVLPKTIPFPGMDIGKIDCSSKKQTTTQGNPIANDLSYTHYISEDRAVSSSAQLGMKDVEQDISRLTYPRKTTRLECEYSASDYLCMDCWLYFQRTGTRRQTNILASVSSDIGDRLDIEYSPFSFVA